MLLLLTVLTILTVLTVITIIWIGMLLLSLDAKATLYPACVFCGAAYGAQCSIVPALAADLFGVKHLGAIYTANSVSLALGSFGLASFLTAHFYELEQHRQGAHGSGGAITHAPTAAPTDSSGGSNSGNDCFGAECFRPTYVVCTCLCALAVLQCGVVGRGMKRTAAAVAVR
jgi:hypothetical protein